MGAALVSGDVTETVWFLCIHTTVLFDVPTELGRNKIKNKKITKHHAPQEKYVLSISNTLPLFGRNKHSQHPDKTTIVTCVLTYFVQMCSFYLGGFSAFIFVL